MTFHGTPRASAEVMAHVHESPKVMTIPLILLALGATFGGIAGLPMVEASGEFWRGSIFVLPEHNVLEEAHHVPFLVKILPLIMGVIGIGLAYLMYIRQPGPAGAARRRGPGALPLPAQQVVLRRALRPAVRRARQAPRPRPVAGGRRRR